MNNKINTHVLMLYCIGYKANAVQGNNKNLNYPRLKYRFLCQKSWFTNQNSYIFALLTNTTIVIIDRKRQWISIHFVIVIKKQFPCSTLTITFLSIPCITYCTKSKLQSTKVRLHFFKIQRKGINYSVKTSIITCQ